MAIGYDDRVVRRLKAAATLTKYQVVKEGSTAATVDVCGSGEHAFGIVTSDADMNDFVDVVVEGVYHAYTAAPVTRPAILAAGASGTVRTAVSSDAYILGELDVAQASATTSALVAVAISKNVISIS